MLNTISEYLTKWALSKPDDVYCEDINGLKLTFLELEDKVNQCCDYLSSLSITKGQVISIAIPNNISFIIMYLASIRSGVIINPCQASLSKFEVEKNLQFVKSDLLFTHKEIEFDNDKIDTKVSLFSSDKEFLKLLDNYNNDHFKVDALEDSITCYYNSSGTTGNSKYIKYSHKNMLFMIESVVETFGFDSNSRHLGILPFSFTSITNYSFLPTIFSGGYLLLSDNFMSIRPKFWDIIHEYKINYVQIVPTIAFTMISSKYEDSSIMVNDTLDFIGCGSAPLSIETQKIFHKKFKIPLANLYGLSESGPSHFDDPTAQDWEPGSIGVPLYDYNCKVVDKEFNEQPDGVIGEFALKGRNLFVGYLNNKNAETDAFNSGYFLTGDLGYKHPNGKFFFNDRKKDLIIRGGVNITPSEIEDIIFTVNGVVSAAVVGAPNPMLGQDIVAFVECDKNFEGIEVLKTILKTNLQAIKIPSRIEMISKMPKGPTGKILKKELREILDESN